MATVETSDRELAMRHLKRALTLLKEPSRILLYGSTSGITGEQSLFCRNRVDRTMATLEGLATYLSMSPAALLGARGGKALANERGPEYFARLNAMRKTHGGGRPPKEKRP